MENISSFPVFVDVNTIFLMLYCFSSTVTIFSSNDSFKTAHPLILINPCLISEVILLSMEITADWLALLPPALSSSTFS
ncbi:MAG TPA: hypothetical protein DCY00_08345 [Actinobacteria bacterium]|nr:hypothetical protein [Actinomycetota bacterium]